MVKSKREFLQTELAEVLSKHDNALVSSFLEAFYENIMSKYDLKNQKIKLILTDENFLPTSIFVKELGILEAIVKYLHENENMRFKQISQILKRSPNNIAVSYKNSVRKHKSRLKADFTIKIPYYIFSEKYTVFESICLYLKIKMNFHEIAVLLNRNDRTIWTIHNRAIKKNEK